MLTQFKWHGINAQGKLASGKIIARHSNAAHKSLRKQGIQSLHLTRVPIFTIRHPNIQHRHITILTQQLAIMLSAGVTLLDALTTLATQTTHHKLKTLIEQLKRHIQAGEPFSQALRKNPQYFNQLYYQLIYAGEKAGTLVSMLEHLVDYRQRIEHLQHALKKALTYPTIIIFVAIAVIGSLLLIVVPQIENLYHQMDATLPTVTITILNLSTWLKNAKWLIATTCAGMMVSIYMANKYMLWMRQYWDQSLLKLPMIGAIIHNLCIAQLARTLAITYTAGIPVIQALQLTGASATNCTYQTAIELASRQISQGKSLYHALQITQLFSPLFLQMLRLGETSGKLTIMLEHAAKQHEFTANHTIEQLLTYIEPIIIVTLCLCVGFFMIAMYLPIFQLGSVM